QRRSCIATEGSPPSAEPIVGAQPACSRDRERRVTGIDLGVPRTAESLGQRPCVPAAPRLIFGKHSMNWLLRTNMIEIEGGGGHAASTGVEEHPECLQRTGVVGQGPETSRSGVEQARQIDTHGGAGVGIDETEAGLAPVEITADLNRHGLRSAG